MRGTASSNASGRAETIGQVISAARKLSGLTQSQLSLRMDYSQGAISLVGTQKRKMSKEFAEKLAEIFGGSSDAWLAADKLVRSGKNQESATEMLKSIAGMSPVFQPPENAVHRLVNHEMYDLFWEQAPERGAIIEYFDPRRIGNSHYYTRIGAPECDLEQGDKFYSEPVCIPKRSSVKVRTRESFNMPMWLEADFHATSTIANKPLIVHNGPTIDPGFDSYLTVTVSNETDEDIFIDPEEKFLKVRFSVLGVSPIPEEEFRKKFRVDEITDEDILDRTISYQIGENDF